MTATTRKSPTQIIPVTTTTQQTLHSDLYNLEYRFLQFVQRAANPVLTKFALFVHGLTRKTVIISCVAALTCLNSLPRGISITLFICASNCVNTAIKWAVQRPRPTWLLSKDDPLIHGVRNIGGAWEDDFSFPSGHTQFISGLLVLLYWEYPLPDWSLAPLLLGGVVVGLTRNYVGVHFGSDTGVGWALGVGLACVWGAWAEPVRRILLQDPSSSGLTVYALVTATAVAFVFLAVCLAGRSASAPVDEHTKRVWLANATASLPEGTAPVSSGGESTGVWPKERRVEKLVPMLAVIWTGLAVLALHGHLPGAVLSLPEASLSLEWYWYLARIGVGVGGLVVWAGLMLLLTKKFMPQLVHIAFELEGRGNEDEDEEHKQEMWSIQDRTKLVLQAAMFAGVVVWIVLVGCVFWSYEP